MADISITAGSVLKSVSGSFLRAISATTITAGQFVYQLANGSIGLADSNGTAPANTVAGVALNGASVGQPIDYVDSDPSLTSGGTLTSGNVIYLSDTPGGMTATYADIASGSTVIILGVVNTDGTLNFNPTTGGVK